VDDLTKLTDEELVAAIQSRLDLVPADELGPWLCWDDLPNKDKAEHYQNGGLCSADGKREIWGGYDSCMPSSDTIRCIADTFNALPELLTRLRRTAPPAAGQDITTLRATLAECVEAMREVLPRYKELFDHAGLGNPNDSVAVEIITKALANAEKVTNGK
jgi:hypothetical protein